MNAPAFPDSYSPTGSGSYSNCDAPGVNAH
jgi:hypothetical protein